VVDRTAGRTVFAGKLAALHDVALGDFAQGDSHRYRFVVSFPGGGPPALDNHFQVATTTVSYVWSAGPVAPPPRPTATPPASAPPSTLGTTVSRPTARLIASARQRGRGGRVQLQLVCPAACRARFTATRPRRGSDDAGARGQPDAAQVRAGHRPSGAAATGARGPLRGAHDDRPGEGARVDRGAKPIAPKEGAARQKAGSRPQASVNAPGP
jgi:hypothetical protein